MKRLTILVVATALMAGCTEAPEDKLERLSAAVEHQLEELDFKQAKLTFGELAELDPNLPWETLGKAGILERQLLFYEALDSYFKVTESKPLYAPAHRGVRRIHMFLGNSEEFLAVAAYTADLPNATGEDKLELAKAHLLVGDTSAASEAVMSALDAGADTTVARLVEASVLFKTGQPDSAELVFQQALSRPVASADFYVEAANYLEQRGYIDSAITVSRVATRMEQGNFFHLFEHFQRCLRNDYLYAARLVLDEVRQINRQGLTILVMEIFYGWRSGEAFLATNTNTELERRVDSNISVIIYDMESRWMVNDLSICQDNAELAYSATIPLGFSQGAKDAVINKLAMLSTEFEISRQAYARIRLSPGREQWQREFKLMETLLALRCRLEDSANVIIDTILARYGDDPAWLTGLADIYADQGLHKYDKAETYYRKALDKNNWYLPALEHELAMYWRLSRFQDGLELTSRHQRMIAIIPSLSLIKAEFLIEADRFDEAMQLIESSIAPLRQNMSWLKKLGRLFELKGRLDLQDSLYNLATRMNPDLPDAWLITSILEINRGNFTNGLEQAERGLSIEPNNISLRVQKARAMYRSGRTEEAVGIFEQLLKERYGNIDANLYYSECLASDSADFRRAEFLGRQTCFFAGNNVRPRSNLCFVFDRQGNVKRLKAEATNAVRNHPNEPEPHFYLGIATFQLGENEAREHLKKAIDLGLSGNLLERAREALNKI